jgi:chitosanase
MTRWTPVRAATVGIAALSALLVAGPFVPPSRAAIRLTAAQRVIMRQLVSVYENSTTTPAYGYVANLHDGCGYTAGWVGFCTATGDLLEVVRRYDGSRPSNPLRRYARALASLARAGSDRVAALAGFPRAWRRAARDPRFRAAQNDVADRLYLQPALRLASREGLRTPLAAAIFFETAVQHGTGPDPDGLPALVARTERLAHGRPGSRISEASWLTVFDRVRLRDLLHPHDHARLADWPQSADRARSDQRLVDEDRFELTAPIPVHVFGDSFVLG